MSIFGAHKARITKAANAIRKKITEFDEAILEPLDFTVEAGKDPQLILSRKSLLFFHYTSLGRTVDFLRAQREKAEEFARQHPDEKGEFPLLQQIQDHWDSSGLDDLVEEAETLRDRADALIKLLPSSEALYHFRASTVPPSFVNLTPNPTQDPNCFQQPAPEVRMELASHSSSHERDRPLDPDAVVPAHQAPLPARAPSVVQGFDNPPHNPLTHPTFVNPPPVLHQSNPFSPFFVPNTNSSPPSVEQSLKLPTFEIPTFHGDIDNFLEFWDLFSTAVHNNINVPVPLKFMYLKSHLRGPAASIIAGFQSTAENYEDAVRTLTNTYGRPEILRNRLWDKLMQLSPASDSPLSQRATLCTIKAIWTQLTHLKEDSSAIGTLKIIRTKFPRRTREKIGEYKLKGDAMWTVDELLSTLDTIIDRLETIEDADPSEHFAYNSQASLRQDSSLPRRYSSANRADSAFTRYRTSSYYPRRPSVSRTPSPYSRHNRPPTPYYPRNASRSPSRPRYTIPSEPYCAFCRDPGHPSERCNIVRDVAQRRSLLVRYRLCWLCLQQGHGYAQCDAPVCEYCGRIHHRALCWNPPRPRRSPTPFNRRTTRSVDRSYSPRRVQFQRENYQPVSDAYRGYSRASSPRTVYSKSPSPSRRQSSVSPARRASSAHRSRSISAVHSTTCTPDQPETSTDAQAEPLDHHQIRVGSHSPSSCISACSQESAQPRLMVVHAITKNYKTDTDELLTVFLDSGSQFSFICTSLARYLGLSFRNTKTFTTLTFGGHQFTEESSEVTLILWDQYNNPIYLDLWTREKITTVPWTNTRNDKDIVDLGDRVEVDVLIGIDNYWRIVDLHRNEKLPSGLILSHTRFGPVLSGQKHPPATNTLLAAKTPFEDDEIATHQLIKSLFGLDLVATEDEENTRDANIIRHFYDTVRIVDGNIYVSFPWKTDHPPLADNKALAFCRLQNQYDKFRATPTVWNNYCQIINEQLKMGIIEDVTRVAAQGPNVYYIPHQAVYKQGSATTKLRIVLDASSHQKGVPSLNDCLHQGPSLLPDLVGTLVRSRFHPYLVIADVEKPFHQIYLHQDQRDSTRFLWLKDVHQPPSSENLRLMRFARLPFGVNASPFLLSMSIRYFLEQDPANRLKEEILANTYVDNVIVGAKTTQECVDKCKECKDIFSRMHMNLRQFMSNNQRALASIPQESCMMVQGQYVSLLGIRWNPTLDILHVPLNIARQAVTSKRTALQVYASTFDPLGLLTPLLIKAKMFIQDLWELGYGWDDNLNDEDTQKWNLIVQDMSSFQLSVPRFIGDTFEDEYDLVVCSDASKRVYATAIYILTRPHRGIPRSTLLFAKAKLAPPGAITIPRMELLASHMAAKIVHFLKAQLKVKLCSVKFLIDSQVVLYWIYSLKPLKTYVVNRVKYIRRVLDELEAENILTGFYYLATQTNPADCATRGLTASELQQHIWWTGPTFFTTPFPQWPCTSFQPSQPIPPGAEAEELRIPGAVVNSVSTTKEPYRSFVPFARTNSYTKLVRITAYILKYVAKLRQRVRTRNQCETQEECFPFNTMSTTPTVTSDDFMAAELVLIREHYRESQRQMDGSYVKKLHTKCETDGTIRVDLRMDNAQTSDISSSPILVLSSHPLCEKLIAHYHYRLFHAGPSHLLSALREKFFIPRLKRLVKSFVSRCVVCKRYQGRVYTYPRAPDLPAERVTRSRPFQHIGLDYFGPIPVRLLNCDRHKVWVCLVTCMSTRALHLEVVRDNSTFQFLLAFRRFMAFRGTPDTVTSDNAPTFKLGEEVINNQLLEIKKDAQMDQFLTSHSIRWTFITPYSPWKGGFYERLVRSVKIALKKAIRNQILDIWLFETLIVEIEAILNTRPLFPVNSVNPSANPAMRPIDLISPKFQIARLRDTLPRKIANSASDSYQMLNARYRILQNDLDCFWNLWQKEYLTALADREAIRTKARSSTRLPRVGEVVLIKQDAPRSSWPLGLILELHTSLDGNVRSAKVKTGKRRVLDRAVNHLLPLEIVAEDEEPVERGCCNRAKAQRQHCGTSRK